MPVSRGMRSRLQEIAITGELFIFHLKAAHESYHRDGSNIIDVFPELLIGTVVWVNATHNPGKAISINKISREAGIPRSTVQHRVRRLVREGAIIKNGRGFLPNHDYIELNVSTDLQDRVAAKIIKTADLLRKLNR